MARRRSRRRKSSYQDETAASGLPAQLVVEDLSPRARRLAESGVIDLAAIAGSGEGGRITSGDILHAARVMEVEQSVARIETVGRDAASEPETGAESEAVVADDGATGDGLPEEVASSPVEEIAADQPEEVATDQPDDVASEPESMLPDDGVPALSDVTTSSAPLSGGETIEVPPSPWDAYNGSSEGLAESALPGAEQSWGEAEANIAAIAEEAAAQADGQEPAEPEPPVAFEQSGADELVEAESSEGGEIAADTAAGEEFVADEPVAKELAADEPRDQQDVVDGEDVDQPGAEEPAAEQPMADQPVIVDHPVEQSTGVAAARSDIEAAVDPEPTDDAAEAAADVSDEVVAAASAQPQPEPGEAMMDFGTLELVDPESVWAEGAEDFAPWFLAHSKQLGDVLGLDAGLSEARQFTTKSATGVLGRDDNGEDVVVVSSQNAVADDSDLGRALGMAASSGAATVALVSATFNEDQLKALAWLNNQTRSGVRWYGIEMRVVRIADSPAAMLFDLVASPPD